MRLAVVLAIFLVLFLKCKQSSGQPISNKSLQLSTDRQAGQIVVDGDDYYDQEEEDEESKQSLNDQGKYENGNNEENEPEGEVEKVQPDQPLSQSVYKKTVKVQQVPQEVIKKSANENNDEAEKEEENDDVDEYAEDEEEDADDEEEDADDDEYENGADDYGDEEDLIDEEQLLNFQRKSFWRNLVEIL